MAWLNAPRDVDQRDLALVEDGRKERLDDRGARPGRRRADAPGDQRIVCQAEAEICGLAISASGAEGAAACARTASVDPVDEKGRDDRRAALREAAEIELVGIPAQHGGGVLEPDARAPPSRLTAACQAGPAR